MPSPLDPLWETLLRGGVSRRHARRYLEELNDHLDDLIAEAPGPDARARALARLGDVEVLASAMIARRDLWAWSRRAPVVAYLIASPLSLPLCATLAMGCVVAASAWAGAGPASSAPWLRSLAGAAVFFCNAVLPAVLGWVAGVTAIRRRAAPLWPCLGMTALAALGAAMQLAVTLPSAAGKGEVELASGLGGPSGWTAWGARFAITLSLVLIPYAGLLLWRRALASEPSRS